MSKQRKILAAFLVGSALLCAGCAEQAASVASMAEQVQQNTLPAAAVEMVEAVEYEKAPLTEQQLLLELETGTCPDCGGALTAKITSREDQPCTQQDCQKYLYGTDEVCWEEITYIQHCDTCGKDVGEPQKTTVNTQTICHGWTNEKQSSKTGQMVEKY